jgi:hypothetical protein
LHRFTHFTRHPFWNRLLALALTVPAAAGTVVASGAAAHAEANGVGLTPALGWSSWSYVRHNPTAAVIEAQAAAMKSSGLEHAGFQYVNVDDFWYQCPGSQGPNVDQYGRWVTDPAKFPPSGAEDGIQVVADYVHNKGLKFGLYVTPGISAQAVAQNTAIEGTPYHADDIATAAAEKNYNCKGMVGIDYTKPGAQQFIDSWADEFAAWGVDYIKIDGVGTSDVGDVQAWSQALRQTGRPIHLELSNSLAISAAPTWAQYSNGWRTGGDIECYGCESGGSSYPLTAWSSVSSRFNQVANWQPYGGPGAFNDYDSLEIGNGANDGLTPDERETQMSLWSLASSPLILGTDLTNLDATDLKLLKNKDVLAVDQDAVDASRISSGSTAQVFAKTEANGDVIVGLFNTGTLPEVVSTSATSLGLAANTPYVLDELWSGDQTEAWNTIAASVAPHGVALYRITPTTDPMAQPPSTALGLGGATSVTAGQPATVTVSYTNNGPTDAQTVRLRVNAPAGWTVTPSQSTVDLVATGQTVQASFQVTAPQPAQLFQTDAVTAEAHYTWPGQSHQTIRVDGAIVTASPAVAPYQTYSSATDAPAAYAESQDGTQFGIRGAGADLYSSTDAYSSIYLKGAVGAASTIQTEVTSQQNMAGFAKAGILVRNSISGSGSTPEGVILFESPSGGIQLEWAKSGGNFINAVTPANGTIADTVPVWLRLVRSGSTYTGYYSTDDSTWTLVGSATLGGQAAGQDAGMFVTSHASGSPGTVYFNGFAVS